jgi:hypothetical protein
LETEIERRVEQAKTTKLLAETLNAALADPSPVESACKRLGAVMAREDPTLDQDEIKMTYQNLVRPGGGMEALDALKDQAAHYTKQAPLDAARAQVRRVE